MMISPLLVVCLAVPVLPVKNVAGKFGRALPTVWDRPVSAFAPPAALLYRHFHASLENGCCRSRNQQRQAPAMGIFDLDFEVRWDQQAPLRPPSDFELWLDVRPSTVRTIQDRQAAEQAGKKPSAVDVILSRMGIGDPLIEGWGFQPNRGGDAAEVRDTGARGLPKGEAAEEAAQVMARLYEELRGAGPLLKKCCPGPPVQGLVFDYRCIPTRGVGDLPLVSLLRDGGVVGLSGESAGRDLRVSNPMSMLAEAVEYMSISLPEQRQYLFIEDVVYANQPVLRPILIDELCTRGSASARGQQTKVLTSVKNIQDLTEGVLLLQYGKEWLRTIGGDREYIELLRNKGQLSQSDYNEIERRGWLPPVISLQAAGDAGMNSRELERRADEGLEEMRAKYEAQRAKKEEKDQSGAWVQTSLFATEERERESLLAETWAREDERLPAVKHALVLPPDAELWAVALALRADQMWEREPIEPLSLLFPKDLGGVPDRLMKHARNALAAAEKKLATLEHKYESYLARLRFEKDVSSSGKTKGIDLDDSWRF